MTPSNEKSYSDALRGQMEQAAPPVGTPPRGRRQSRWIVLAAVAVILAFMGGIAAFVLSGISGPEKLAVATAESSPALVKRLGQPMKTSWAGTAHIEVSGATGHADFSLHISGPKGSGTLYAVESMLAGMWRLDQLEFAAEGSDERLDLLSPDSAPKPTAPPH
ncbi:MAG TPA: cytochrome c oxidase assembly factor Coa1 family protein [Candidatus Acidoferrales bacterium]|nr:cytochrome c oxidase assembly factor Coa1 family protein [Candidatus Acidoferrales bacterium]